MGQSSCFESKTWLSWIKFVSFLNLLRQKDMAKQLTPVRNHGKLFLSWPPLDLCLPFSGGGFVFVAFRPDQFHRPPGASIPSALAAVVRLDPTLQIDCDPGVQRTV